MREDRRPGGRDPRTGRGVIFRDVAHHAGHRGHARVLLARTRGRRGLRRRRRRLGARGGARRRLDGPLAVLGGGRALRVRDGRARLAAPDARRSAARGRGARRVVVNGRARHAAVRGGAAGPRPVRPALRLGRGDGRLLGPGATGAAPRRRRDPRGHLDGRGLRGGPRPPPAGTRPPRALRAAAADARGDPRARGRDAQGQIHAHGQEGVAQGRRVAEAVVRLRL
mmetsp:Transcript_31362/g.97049  ORF Transcript_31362/g.97049 Transcript_31362/m.97049 type:complete len:225 (+) Transcript_31362:1000-1674(+)